MITFEEGLARDLATITAAKGCAPSEFDRLQLHLSQGFQQWLLPETGPGTRITAELVMLVAKGCGALMSSAFGMLSFKAPGLNGQETAMVAIAATAALQFIAATKSGEARLLGIHGPGGAPVPFDYRDHLTPT
jgi:hypothetical protein